MNKAISKWHSPEEIPDKDRKVLYAITCNDECEYRSLVGTLRYTTEYAVASYIDTVCIAWAYIDEYTPSRMLDEWKKSNLKSEEQRKLDKIRELEKQIKQLKSELNATPSL